MQELDRLVSVCRGSPSAPELDALVRSVHPYLVLALKAYGNNGAPVEDFVQEALSKIILRFGTFRGSTFNEFRAWSIRIATRTALDYFRRADVRKVTILEPEEIDRIREAGGQGNEGLSADASAALETLMKLKPESRELLTLHYLQGLDYTDIAELTGKSYDAIRMAIERARKEAQAVFEKQEMDAGRT